MAKITSIRARKMRDQNGRCFYCGVAMWSWNPESYCRRHGITSRSVHHFQCTAEHLTPRCDGGDDTEDNIVAACRYCNNRRHQYKRPPAAEAYREKVRASVANGRWRTAQKRPGKRKPARA